MVGGSNVDTSKAMALLWVAFTHVSTALHYVMLILSFVIKKEGGKRKMQQKKWQGKKNLCCALKYFWLTHNQIVIFSIILMFSLGWMRLGFHHLFWVLLVHKWIVRVKFSFWVSWLMNDASTSVSQQVHLETAHAFVLCFLEGKKK